MFLFVEYDLRIALILKHQFCCYCERFYRIKYSRGSMVLTPKFKKDSKSYSIETKLGQVTSNENSSENYPYLMNLKLTLFYDYIFHLFNLMFQDGHYMSQKRLFQHDFIFLCITIVLGTFCTNTLFPCNEQKLPPRKRENFKVGTIVYLTFHRSYTSLNYHSLHNT